MKGLGEGIAFAGFCLAAAWMSGSGVEGHELMWFGAAIWLIVSDWGQDKPAN